MQKRFWKASRLFEIFAIIFILAGLGFLTIPYFDKFKCRSKQSEARMELLNLFSSEKLFFSNNNHYNDLESLKKSGMIQLSEKYYHFKTTQFSHETFIIQAISKPNSFSQKDIWSINQNKELKNLQNACPYP